jgi:uncharacterized protein YbjQ (UPF0145 family)
MARAFIWLHSLWSSGARADHLAVDKTSRLCDYLAMAATGPRKHIAVSTTDEIPEWVGLRVKRSGFHCVNHSSLAEGYEGLTDWARENGYDAIVGVRLQITPHVHSGGGVGHETRTEFHYTIYGTAVEYHR